MPWIYAITKEGYRFQEHSHKCDQTYTKAQKEKRKKGAFKNVKAPTSHEEERENE